MENKSETIAYYGHGCAGWQACVRRAASAWHPRS